MTLLRLWLAATVIVLVGLAVWAFAPVLVFVMLLTAALGGLAAVMIVVAHRVRDWRDRQ